MWGQFFTETWWERSSILCLCWITVPLKNRLLGNYVPLNKHCIQLAHTYLCLTRMHWVTQYAAIFITAFFFFPKIPFLQLSAFFSQKIAESRECGRIESQLADWIVFCSISGCIKRLRLWTYKKVMDASSLRLDRSELTSAEGRKGTKKKSVIYWPSQWKQRRRWMPLSSHCWQIQRRAPIISTGFLPYFFPP